MRWRTYAALTGIPSNAYVRRKGYQVEDAKDLTQQFFRAIAPGRPYRSG